MDDQNIQNNTSVNIQLSEENTLSRSLPIHDMNTQSPIPEVLPHNNPSATPMNSNLAHEEASVRTEIPAEEHHSDLPVIKDERDHPTEFVEDEAGKLSIQRFTDQSEQEHHEDDMYRLHKDLIHHESDSIHTVSGGNIKEIIFDSKTGQMRIIMK